MPTKVCLDCKIEKPLDAFSPRKKSPDGRASHCKDCHNARSREVRDRLYGGGREYHLRRRYGIGQVHVDRMLEEQGNACAICRRPAPEHVDHDHRTSEVRGLLCFNCNQALGNARDDIGLLRGMIRYLYASQGIGYEVPVEIVRPAEDTLIECQPRPHGLPTPNPGSPIEVAFVGALGA
jgi:hypothetical protein